ncbi:MAG: hypothetical protein HC925_00965 [Coleofasciculaceae cyanobacterium SM2_3_26]|nr:hypothetical protein [Coleofasciculaceae cyanobacterium SM2_3_26]
MVGFRNATQGVQTVSNWWDNGGNQIAFSRGNKGFVVINQENAPLQRTFQTGLPAGEYCNVIAFDFNPATGACTGAGIQVNRTGEATIEVHPRSAVALHVGASIDTGTGNATQ